MSRPPESKLIERSRKGDTVAFAQLISEYEAPAFRLAYLITRSGADAEEAVQDGFLNAFRALGRFRAGRPFKPWLLQIVANEARSRRRSAARHAVLALRAADERRSGDAAPSPELALMDDERRRRLLEAYGRLGERDQEIIACRFFLELTEQEAADTLGVRPGTVKSRTSRALDRLREHLKDSDG